jgi:hypothetical protein
MHNKKNIYYGDVYMCDKRKIYGGKFTREKLAIKNICHQAIFYPMNIYKNYKYLTKYKFLADYQYNMVVFKKTNFIYLKETIAIYEGGGGSAINTDYEFIKDRNKLITENLGVLPLIYSIIYQSLRKIYRIVIKR